MKNISIKIHIIGGSGTGKTFISKKLENKLKIPHYDLDNIFWDNTSNSYGIKTSAEKRDEKLNKILENDNWIIEGVYYKWLSQSFSKADYIFILKSNSLLYKYRIVMRFLKRKLGISEGKNETFKSLIGLIKWADDYNKNELPIIIKFLEPYNDKVVELENSDDIFKYIKI